MATAPPAPQRLGPGSTGGGKPPDACSTVAREDAVRGMRAVPATIVRARSGCQSELPRWPDCGARGGGARGDARGGGARGEGARSGTRGEGARSGARVARCVILRTTYSSSLDGCPTWSSRPSGLGPGDAPARDHWSPPRCHRGQVPYRPAQCAAMAHLACTVRCQDSWSRSVLAMGRLACTVGFRQAEVANARDATLTCEDVPCRRPPATPEQFPAARRGSDDAHVARPRVSLDGVRLVWRAIAAREGSGDVQEAGRSVCEGTRSVQEGGGDVCEGGRDERRSDREGCARPQRSATQPPRGTGHARGAGTFVPAGASTDG